MFPFCSNELMERVAPLLDDCLARSIAEWLQNAPRPVLADLADTVTRKEAAAVIGGLIVAHLTMDYPEFVEAAEPRLPF